MNALGWMTDKEVAAVLRCDVRSLRRDLAASRDHEVKPPCVTRGRRRYWQPNNLWTWLEELERCRDQSKQAAGAGTSVARKGVGPRGANASTGTSPRKRHVGRASASTKGAARKEGAIERLARKHQPT